MTQRTVGSAIIVLAALAAAVSCQRPLEGSPCPCVSGYQCCAAEQACYPESAGCPGTVPGALVWTAAGLPTFDQVGNLYVDEENGAHAHAISLLDKQTGKARWTETSASQLRCSTKDTALFVRFPNIWSTPPVTFAEVLGVSTADGTRRWSAPINGITCSKTQEQIYVVDTSTSPDGIAKVYATRDGATLRSGRIEGPASGAILIDIHDNVGLVSWSEGSNVALQALDFPEGHEGSVRWTTRFPQGTDSSWSFGFTEAGGILALTGDSASGRSLARLAVSDARVVWRHATTGSDATPIRSKWPGIILLTEEQKLVAVSEETGAVLWTFPLTEGEGYEPGRPWTLDSGDLLISYDQAATTTGAASTLHKLLGADGKVQWTFGPAPGSFHPIDADEYYLLHDGVLSQVNPRTGTYGWSFAFVERGDYPRAVVGSDGEQLLVRTGPGGDAECAASCLQKLLMLSRRDGSVVWETGSFAPELGNKPFNHAWTDATHAYVFTQTPGSLRTGTLWAFAR